jgi:hypothetical protein
MSLAYYLILLICVFFYLEIIDIISKSYNRVVHFNAAFF